MKALYLLIASISTLTLSSLLSSCGGCCTGEELAPALRPAPNFEPLGQQPVSYQK